MVKQIFTHKIALLLLLCLLLMIPVHAIMDLNRERQAYRSQAIHSIMASSSGPQRLLGPVLVQPYTRAVTVEQDGKRFVREERVYRYLLPDRLDVRASMEVTPRKLGIYQAQVYQGRLSLSGHLPASLADKALVAGNPDLSFDAADPALIPGKPYLSLVLSDARGISSVPELQLGERRIPFAPGALLGDGLAGIHAPLDSLPGEDGRFHIELNLQGMNALEVVPIGQDSRFNLSGNWPHPNFIGDFLPGSRTLNDQGFDASWQTSWFATDMERRFTRMMKGGGERVADLQRQPGAAGGSLSAERAGRQVCPAVHRPHLPQLLHVRAAPGAAGTPDPVRPGGHGAGNLLSGTAGTDRTPRFWLGLSGGQR